MVEFVLPAPALPTIAVQGSDARFAVRRIFCVGRNYAAHAREMGKDPQREPPFFFGKPADAVVDSGQVLPFPPQTKNLHHEAELTVALASGGVDIPQDQALNHVWGYAASNDLTRRDLQGAAKELGRPWMMGKGFDASAIIGPLAPATKIGHPASGKITAHVNGELRQTGDLNEMIWSIPEIIAFLSNSIRLAPGDLIMTGTPAGVGPIAPGETCEIDIEGVGSAVHTYLD